MPRFTWQRSTKFPSTASLNKIANNRPVQMLSAFRGIALARLRSASIYLARRKTLGNLVSLFKKVSCILVHLTLC